MLKRNLFRLSLALLLPGSVALAAPAKVWTTQGPDQFATGKLEGVSVLSTGEVELAPQTEKIEGLEAELVWDVVAASDGTVYIATGAPAAVYTIKAGKAELLYKSEEKQVLSVLPLPDGSVLAATAPQGIIVRINRHGEATTFVDLEDSYVWDMALGPHNEIYCATGPQGRLLELNRSGKVTELLKVKQNNLTCLAVDKDGTVYAGTAPDGIIYRVDSNGRASVLYDAEENEVHALAIGPDGVLYACTSQGPQPGAREGQPPQAGTAPTGPQRSPQGPGPVPGGAPPASSLYRIIPDQGAVQLANFGGMPLLSMALVDGRVLVGTGANGRLLSVDRDSVSRILTQFDAAHVTAMTTVGETVIIGTSNGGSLWQMKQPTRDSGSYVSKPFDARFLSRWGRVWWQQRVQTGQDVRVKVRTGNSAEPDAYWSAWSDWASDPTGAELKLPMGQFAQFCAELTARPHTGTPQVLDVHVSYSQANRKPEIEELAVDGKSASSNDDERRPGPQPGRGLQAGPQAQRPPARPTPGEKLIAWRASDPNDDELSFDLYYKGLGDQDWKPIKKGIRGENGYALDTTKLPDGFYLLKLVASDDPVRPKSEALSDEKVTTPVLIENTPPAVTDLSARRQPDGSYEILGVAQAKFSPLTEIQVSLNAGDWKPVFPDDGILDSPRESFTYRTEVLGPGEHVFVFAATDSNDNTGSARVVVTVKGTQ